MGRMHSDAQLTWFSSFSLGKINKFLLRSLVRRFAGSSSVKFLFLLCTRQNKQVSFALAYASVPAHAKDDGLPRYRASNVQMSEWKFAYIHNECSHYSPKATNPNGWCSKKTRMRNAVALSQWISPAH